MGFSRVTAPGVMAAVLLAAVGSAEYPSDVQTGRASVVSEEFEGRETASGETFDNEALVAAHPAYPPGTRLRVTNVKDDKWVEVRVVDHGPREDVRRAGVIIDLSRAAAERLGFLEQGVARVRVERIAGPD